MSQWINWKVKVVNIKSFGKRVHLAKQQLEQCAWNWEKSTEGIIAFN